jgi:hypothetical protein
MTTNYTTKTASLKATQADIRKVEATKLMVSPDGKSSSEKKDVLELINKAAESAAISVGRDADTSWSVTEDEVTTGVKKINFMGAFVNVVPDGDTINLYIGENKNNPSYSSLNDITAENYYVFASSTNAWSLPAGATAGSKFAKCSALGSTETISLQGGAAIGNIGENDTIKVTVTSDKGTIEYETTKISAVAGKTAATLTAEKTDGTVVSTDAPATKSWNDQYSTKGIQVDGNSLLKYTSADAKNGLTPNSSTGKFSVTIDNDKVVGAKGGWYKVTVQLGSTSKATSLVYVYGTQAATPSVGTVTMAYTGSENPRWVSGLDYDASGSFTLTVKDIANTQQSMTTTSKRAAITKVSGHVDFATTLIDPSQTAGTGETKATLKSGTTATNETAVYEYSATKSASASTATIVTAKAKVQAYGQSAVAGTAVESNAASSTKYLYTATTTSSTDTGAKASFIDDTLRLPYAVLTDSNGKVTGLTITSDTWNSQKTIADSGEAIYKQALLVQNGVLKHPSQDSTKRYTTTNATGKRYYVKKISTGSGTGAQTTYTISGSNLNNSNVKLWAVCANTDNVATAGAKAVLLNAIPADGGVASSVSASSIKFTIGGAIMTCTPASAFYLVIEIANGATQTISPITVANA